MERNRIKGIGKGSSAQKSKKSDIPIVEDSSERKSSIEVERHISRSGSRSKDVFDDESDAGTLHETRGEPDRPESVEDSESDNVQVCVRIRPLLKEEREKRETYAWSWSHNTITQTAFTKRRNQSMARFTGEQTSSPGPAPSSAPAYAFDHLYDPEHTNEDIFSSVVQKIVSKAMRGFHGSIFSYGQTSSGKTFTMNGTAKQPGLIPQAIYMCFDSVAQYRDREFLFRVSYLEIYNETVHDLLNPVISPIRIQHDPKLGTVLSGVKEQVVMNPAQVIALLQGGEAYRHVGTTDMNQKSSRAHTLFKLIIESKALDSQDAPHKPSGSPDPIRVSTLNLVDLAGSENAKMTNSRGDRAREAKHINQSLLTLSTIIHRLCDECSTEDSTRRALQHLPYRDSKLTRILQTALSGNSLISIICTISPTVRCAEESNNTLKFASRAKTIRMDARVNESMDDKTLLRAYRQEIEELKAKLAAMESMMRTGGDEGEKPPQQSLSALEDPDTDGDNQLIMLQMIDHMERLILKGEEQAKRDGSTGSTGSLSSSKNRESMTRRASGLPRKDSGGRTAGRIVHKSHSGSGVHPPSSLPLISTVEPGRASSISRASGEKRRSGGLDTSAEGSQSGGVGVTCAIAPLGDDESHVTSPEGAGGDGMTATRHLHGEENKLLSMSEPGSTDEPCEKHSPGQSALSLPAAAIEHKGANGSAAGLGNHGVDEESPADEEGDEWGEAEDFFARTSPRPSDVYSQQKRVAQTARPHGEVTSVGPAEVDIEHARGRSGPDIAIKSSSWSAPLNGAVDSDGLPGGAQLPASSSPANRLEDILAQAPRNASLHAAASTSANSRGNDAKPSGMLKDPVLEGVSQMLQILKQHVHKHNRTPSRSNGGGYMPGLTLPGDVPISASGPGSGSPPRPVRPPSPGTSSFSTPQRVSPPHLPHEQGGAVDGEALGDGRRRGSTRSQPAMDELLLQLKLKDADNSYLAEEVRKLRENLSDKESMLTMLTEGLKEVEVNQEQMLAANSSLGNELDLMHKAYNEVEDENHLLRTEVSRLMACLEAREKQFFEVTGRTREEEEF